jgi:glycosyltransferase involved in cell wall biosynthesis
MLRRAPRAYLRTLWTLISDVRRPADFAENLAVFVKAVAFAARADASDAGHVHAHFANHPATTAWIIHRLTGLPFSFTAHANDLWRRPVVLGRKLADARFVVAVSEYNEILIEEQSPNASVHVVHCGVDVERFRPKPDDDSSEPSGELLCVASLETRKGHRYLFEAFAALAERFPYLRVVLVGDGPARAELEQLATMLEIASRVEFRGATTQAEVAAALDRARVFVLPSIRDATGRMEGIPVALMEAMAAGVPVVATRLSGIPELVTGETGLVVEPGDAPALAAAVASLLEDPGRARRNAAAARAYVAERFDLFTEADRLGDLFAASLAQG